MKTAIALVGLLLAAPLAAEEKYTEFESHTFAGPGGAKLPYRLLKPEAAESGKKYPLVLYLHGFGCRGTDNEAQLKEIAGTFLKAATRKKFPCFVVAPQVNGSWIQHAVFDKAIPLTAKPTAALTSAVEIVQSVVKSHPVDAGRVYVMGYSNGACGVWEILEREPGPWAGAVVMAGAGDPARIGVAKHVPIWVFHGSKDTTIPIERMHEMINGLQHAGGKPLFTIVPSGQHYDARAKGLGEPELLPWLFAQERGKPEVPFEKVAGPKAKLPTSLQK